MCYIQPFYPWGQDPELERLRQRVQQLEREAEKQRLRRRIRELEGHRAIYPPLCPPTPPVFYPLGVDQILPLIKPKRYEQL